MNVSTLIYAPRGCDCRQLAADFAAEAGPDWDVVLVASPGELRARLADGSRQHLVILPDDAKVGSAKAATLIAGLRRIDPHLPVIVTAEKGSVDAAARAIDAGATDFLVRGENLRQRIATSLGKLRGLLGVIDRNRTLDEDNTELRRTLQAGLEIVGNSSPMKRLLAQVRRVAAVPRPVLIVGERGTGKELVARAIHLAAGLASRTLVTVNCAAFGDALLESELFGHEKGAFTGADAARRGKFEQADGGTLFLDEIGNMSLAFQEKILRVVEYGTYTRVGGTDELKTTARILAATNRDLREEIREGRFLADLYDRLTFETIRVPPLRERRGDVALLAQYFLDQFARETASLAGKRLAPAAVATLDGYSFPGNVRELKNLIERAAYRGTAGEIGPEDLGLAVEEDAAAVAGSFHEKVDAFRRRLVIEALKQAGGNQAQAARTLGLPYHQFRYYLRKHAASCTCLRCGAERPEG
jgi:DNA-binding NtrC family response regulator